MSVEWSSNVVLGVKLKDLAPAEIVKNETISFYNDILEEIQERAASNDYTVFNREKEYKGALREVLGSFSNSDFVVEIYAPRGLDDMPKKEWYENVVLGASVNRATENNNVTKIDLNIYELKLQLLSELKDRFNYYGDLELFNILYIV